MSYQVLARKWRPRNFSSLVGQDHVVRALTHALANQRLHHAYLFTGTRGVGKTTVARILAKSLNCQTGVTPTPCGVCSACVEIDGGRFVDLLEVDAATNTRVDEMRQLLENAVYAPTRGRYKVYVIDEVHMLSNSAFNAMLKTLEEPPEHVKFILATTDPQKIPVTVLSRCLQFNLKQMTPGAVSSHLATVLSAEEIPFEEPALDLLAQSAHGSMRDALSLLDQAIAHGGGRVEEQSIRAMLGVIDQNFLLDILQALCQPSGAELLGVVSEISLKSISYGAVLQDLASLLTRIQIAQLQRRSVDEHASLEDRRLSSLANDLTPDFVQLAYQIVIQGRHELSLAPDEYAGFVMTLLRLHCFRPSTVSDFVRQRTTAVLPVSKEQVESTHVVANVGDTCSNQTNQEWGLLVDRMQLSGLTKTLALNCELRALTDTECVLRLDPSAVHLQMKPAPERLGQALGDVLGHPIKLRIELDATEGVTPAAAMKQEKIERQQSALDAIQNDITVRQMIDVLDASIIDGSIKPLN